MNNIIYIVGAVVIVLAVLSYFGFRWARAKLGTSVWRRRAALSLSRTC